MTTEEKSKDMDTIEMKQEEKKKPGRKKKKDRTLQEEYDLAMKEVKELLEKKYYSLKLRVVRVGNAWSVYQGTPSTVWASFRLYTPSIYRGTLKTILKENKLDQKYPKYFRDKL